MLQRAESRTSYIKGYQLFPLEGFVRGISSIIKTGSEDLVQDLFSNYMWQLWIQISNLICSGF